MDSRFRTSSLPLKTANCVSMLPVHPAASPWAATCALGSAGGGGRRGAGGLSPGGGLGGPGCGLALAAWALARRACCHSSSRSAMPSRACVMAACGAAGVGAPLLASALRGGLALARPRHLGRRRAGQLEAAQRAGGRGTAGGGPWRSGGGGGQGRGRQDGAPAAGVRW